jgi:uncharacterized membrane protein
MTKAERHDLASKRAEEYAPTPVNTALTSGVIGATLVGLASIAFGSFYSIDVEAHWILLSAFVAIGFAIPFVSSAYRRSKHRRATSAELKDIDEQADLFKNTLP